METHSPSNDVTRLVFSCFQRVLLLIALFRLTDLQSWLERNLKQNERRPQLVKLPKAQSHVNCHVV